MEKLMRNSMILAAAALALSLGASAAQAKPHSAISLECSKEADAKGLHGKPRKHFREKCKHEAEKAAGYAPSKHGSKKYDLMKGYRSTDTNAGAR